MMSLFNLGNFFISSLREVQRMDPASLASNQTSLSRNRFWRFVLQNGHDILNTGYRHSLDLMVRFACISIFCFVRVHQVHCEYMSSGLGCRCMLKKRSRSQNILPPTYSSVHASKLCTAITSSAGLGMACTALALTKFRESGSPASIH
jgi:hypothetical protein